ncbi:MAG: hypothetical protein HWN67_16620, partial [Candidatus Helarchaeota archaeon]|nr:hypothetical protein [Candidatus Helarchaeota archaeon]
TRWYESSGGGWSLVWQIKLIPTPSAEKDEFPIELLLLLMIPLPSLPGGGVEISATVILLIVGIACLAVGTLIIVSVVKSRR